MMNKDKKQQQGPRADEPAEEPVGQGAPADDSDGTVVVSRAEYEKFKREALEYKDKFVRLYAEFDNTRKRFERDKAEFVKYANEGLLTDFLNIVDDLDRSVEAAHAHHEDYNAFLKGIEMVMVRIHALLKKNQVSPIEATGKIFDPHCHEILMQVDSDEQPDGTVVEEFQKGYRYGDRVIRTAKVKVAMNRASESDANNEETQE